MKNLVWLLLLFSTSALASTKVVFVNKTGSEVRLTGLSNSCVGEIISPETQLIIPSDQSLVVPLAIPIIHSYTVCGSGLCSSTAIGIAKGTRNLGRYIVEVTLDKSGAINSKEIPDHWSIANKECP